MKNSKIISFLVFLAASFLFVQCTTDPIAGPAGVDGIDGVDGVDGVNGTTECAQCHNVSTSEAVHASFMYSTHYEHGTVSRGGSASCARCHSGSGFIDYLAQGAMNDYIPSDAVLTGGSIGPQKFSCNTCHDMHTSFDFANDGYDYALRTLAPVKMMADEAYELDFEGTANICANCHQPRPSYLPPVDNGMGLYEFTSSRWGPHHGPQSTMIEGIWGVNIEGSTAYPAPKSAGHRTNGACTNCHMGESGGQIEGLHTWFPSDAECAKCHTGGIPSEVAGLEDDMNALLDILVAEGILEVEIDEETGEEEVGPVPGTYPILVAEAAWNYRLIQEDQSHGKHNPNYAKALIKNSLEALNNAD